MIRTMENESFEVTTVMDILYGERSDGSDGQFICGDDGKMAIQEGEVIRNAEDNHNYTSFWTKK